MAKRQDSDREVLTSLPRSRPVRRSAKRGDRPATAATPANTAKTAAAAKAASAPAPAKPRPKAAKAGAKAAKPGAKAAGGERASAPKPGAQKRAGAARAATAANTTAATDARTQTGAGEHASARVATPPPRRGQAPAGENTAPQRKVPPAGYAAPNARGDSDGAAGAADLLSTAVQAANELAQIGLTVGRQTLQSLLDRLPKP